MKVLKFNEFLLESVDKIGLYAPNGKMSNLSKSMYDYVRTSDFKQWFGDWENDPENSSKVVDENGEPLIVYHGTPFDFDSMKITDKMKSGWGIRDYGVYFSDSIITAKEYALERPEENIEYTEWCEKLDKLKSEQDYNGWTELYIYGKDKYKPNVTQNTNNLKSGRIIECFLDIKNPFIKDAKGSYWFTALKNIIDISLRGGNDGVVCSNLIEVNNDVQTTYIVFDNKQIRKIQ
jgi:hypothetical protein